MFFRNLLKSLVPTAARQVKPLPISTTDSMRFFRASYLQNNQIFPGIIIQLYYPNGCAWKEEDSKDVIERAFASNGNTEFLPLLEEQLTLLKTKFGPDKYGEFLLLMHEEGRQLLKNPFLLRSMAQLIEMSNKTFEATSAIIFGLVRNPYSAPEAVRIAEELMSKKKQLEESGEKLLKSQDFEKLFFSIKSVEEAGKRYAFTRCIYNNKNKPIPEQVQNVDVRSLTWAP